MKKFRVLLVILHFGLPLSFLPYFYYRQYLNFGIISSAIHISFISYILLLIQRIKKFRQSEILESQLAAQQPSFQHPLPIIFQAPAEYQANEEFLAPPPEYQPNWYSQYELQKSQGLQHSVQESETDANRFQ